MSYQQCPTCQGIGMVYQNYYYHQVTCPTCKGARIIDELSGLPPVEQIPKNKLSADDLARLKKQSFEK